MTQQTATKKKGHEQDRLFESILESLTSALLVFDNSLAITLQNKAAKSLFRDATNAAAALTRVTIEGEYVDWTSELRGIMQTRDPRHFDAVALGSTDEIYLGISISPLRDPDSGRVMGGLLLAEDVSARIGMERRLAVSERLAAVGKLAARVAHELNNPLDGILRYTNLAIRVSEEEGQEKVPEYLGHVRSGIQRMAQIIGGLLEFSRSTPGATEQATINRIVEDAMTTMEGRAQDTGVTIVCNFHQADMPVVRGSSLFQICCNLIKNAIDAMPDGGTLTLTTAVDETDIVLAFEDTGLGLPEDVEKIFEPFYTTKAEGKGTGLGLAVCRELIERHGGEIRAERRTPNGTRMTVRVPIQSCSE